MLVVAKHAVGLAAAQPSPKSHVPRELVRPGLGRIGRVESLNPWRVVRRGDVLALGSGRGASGNSDPAGTARYPASMAPVERARILPSTPRRASARDVVAPTAVSDAGQSV